MLRPYFVRSGVAVTTNVCVVFWCFALAVDVCAQSDTRSDSHLSGSRTTVAQPKPEGASLFLPSTNRDVRLPVMLEGYCIVTLREQQEWLLGSESHQWVFDGQLYWFASQRERTMFAAAPQRYVPALAGHCVVTLAETGVRKRGNPQHGLLHNQRLFFFRSPEEQGNFQSNPEQYANLDLANEGNCLVSLTDEQRRLPGLPETTVVVNGLRYRFVGIHQKRTFLADMRRYGVTRPQAPRLEKTSKGRVNRLPPLLAPQDSSRRNETKLSKSPVQSKVAEVTNKAMGGYCPVSIQEQGIWVAGNASYFVEFDGLTYLMAGEVEQKLFTEKPYLYVPALGGHCVVSETDANRQVAGSIYHAVWHEGEDRLFLFVGTEQKKTFNANPERYLNTDLAFGGNCIVSFLDEERTVAGLLELLTWNQGKRYLFASPTHQEKFREDPLRYQDR